jgi:DNA-binding NtrC family response regulator
MNHLENQGKTGSETAQPGPSVATVDAPTNGVQSSLRRLRAEAEMQAISHALEQTGWNRKRAAELLSISYRGLLYKIRQHNLAPGRSLEFAERAKAE